MALRLEVAGTVEQVTLGLISSSPGGRNVGGIEEDARRRLQWLKRLSGLEPLAALGILCRMAALRSLPKPGDKKVSELSHKAEGLLDHKAAAAFAAFPKGAKADAAGRAASAGYGE